MTRLRFTALVFLACLGIACGEPLDSQSKHVVVYREQGRFGGWPANNGIWQWGEQEILVGFTRGDYKWLESGHSIDGEQRSLLARSTDGGLSWQVEDPVNFVGRSGPSVPLENRIDFSKDGFALRVEGDAYHGADNPEGGFFYSYDKGKSWKGPFWLKGLGSSVELKDLKLTPRTDYVVVDKDTCLVFLSAQDSPANDRTFVAITQDGGLNFFFVSWMVSPNDPYRAVMPSTIMAEDGTLYAAVRRRAVPKDICWVDVYSSVDMGKSWSPPSRVSDTGHTNGNPPALIQLSDGRLLCAYGRRDSRKICAKVSADGGKNWSREITLRDDFNPNHVPDLGYPRLAQVASGSVIAVYYWATPEHPQQHIASTLFKAENIDD